MGDPAPFERLTRRVRTERLLIRPLSPDDVPALFAIRVHPEMAQWMTAAPDDHEEFARAVADRAKRTQAEIGRWVDPAYAGRGYATEGASELLRLCFDGLWLRRRRPEPAPPTSPRSGSWRGSG